MRYLYKAIDAILAFLLLGMVVMVFGNVVLRYVFNSGITLSEEMSRFFFVWLTFIGAVIAMHEGTHLGMDTIVGSLSRRGQIMCLALSQVLIVVCCVLLFMGTWQQHTINATTAAPVSGLPMIYVFGIAYVSAVGIGAHALARLWRVATGRIGDNELIAISASEEIKPGEVRS